MQKTKQIEAVLEQIPQYKEIGQKIAAQRKYGYDWTPTIGVWKKAVARIHPGQMKMRIMAKFLVAPKVVAIRLIRTNGKNVPPFQPGEFIQLKAENKEGKILSKIYNLTSSPNQTSYFEIAVQLKENQPEMSALLFNSQVGDVFTVEEPFGNFIYNPLIHGQKLLFLAKGIGITPFISMIKQKVEMVDNKQKILLLVNAGEQEKMPYFKELSSLSAENSDFNFKIIKIDKEVLQVIQQDYSPSHYYISGDNNFNDYIQNLLSELAIPTKTISKQKIED